jgi:hypothetical protein
MHLFESMSNSLIFFFVSCNIINKNCRQIICGVEELRVNGFYHGDLSLISIFFSKMDKLLIKLFNFRTKGKMFPNILAV